MTGIISLTSRNFDAAVLKADRPVLVDFWAEWCGPCKMLLPILEQVAGELADRAKVGKIDIDTEQLLASQYDIGAIPTMLIFVGGEVRDKLVGLQSKDAIVAALMRMAGAVCVLAQPAPVAPKTATSPNIQLRIACPPACECE